MNFEDSGVLVEDMVDKSKLNRYYCLNSSRVMVGIVSSSFSFLWNS